MVKMEYSSSPTPNSPVSGESNFPTADTQTKSDQTLLTKKKRNLPGMPDPDAEVITLSPKTLLATNRFVCEICNKGFQRDQNLQLHRRGHNLPWKLRQRTNKEVKKRVYVCPEPTCVHHDPSRALGDLTGIKKHFCRKHGEKKYKCERCSKNYAVQSDWKAHMKTCGTREYRCDCGTLFSRRDSFITHRAFCDALAQETGRPQPPPAKVRVVPPPTHAVASSPPPPPLTPSTGVLSPVLSVQSSAELPENQTAQLQPPPPPKTTVSSTSTATSSATATVTASSTVFASIFNASTCANFLNHHIKHHHTPPAFYAQWTEQIVPPSIPFRSHYPHRYTEHHLYSHPHRKILNNTIYQAHNRRSPQPHCFRKQHKWAPHPQTLRFFVGYGCPFRLHWTIKIMSRPWSSTTSSTPSHVKIENNSLASGLGLGLPSSESSGFNNDLMMSSSALFGNKPTTLDFLGLGMGGGAGEASSGGFSAFLSSINVGLDMGAGSFAGVGPAGETWDDPSDRKPSIL
ncbi:hypothetical protein DH2020_035351 [Rehmannia glutinosa]|uniref:C2H2-type domain-containing protein n=1 Tax=Rehmannia glutinosa TaxID=99300 RepID=A0ABR0V9B9_REHGL